MQTYMLEDPFDVVVKLAKQVHGELFAEAYDLLKDELDELDIANVPRY